MVFTLQRYIFREVFKVFILATVALTLMLSLGSVLRPIQQYGAGPRQVIHLMGYFLPITLTFVLPMAALFAASLVYGRFAADNELDACKASGISLWVLVYPGLALAIIVAIANLLLSFYVMPAFVLRAEKSLRADAKQMLFRNIQRKGYYKLPPDDQYRIYADMADLQNDTLLGVAVVELKDYQIRKIVTAESARVHFSPHEGFNEVQITAHNTYQMGTEDEGGFFVESMLLTTDLGSLLGDDIKFKKIDEMKKIKVDPMRFYPVAKLARQTYAQFTAELLAQDITDRINSHTQDDKSPGTSADGGSFYKLHSDRSFVEFTASRCTVRDERKVELTGNVVVAESDAPTRRPLHTFRCTKAALYIEGDELAPTLTMELYNVVSQRQDGLQVLTQRYVIRGLILPKAITDRFKIPKERDADPFGTADPLPRLASGDAGASILKTVSADSIASALRSGPSPQLSALADKLGKKIQRTLVEIKAEMQSRLVFGVGCISLIMIGIGLGIIKKGGHLLSAFGVSSLPAVVLVVCIMMGKNITKNPGAQLCSGVMLMWAGLVFLSLLAVVLYRRLLRN